MEEKIIDEGYIQGILKKTKSPSKKTVFDILEKAKEKKGLDLEEIGFLVNLKDTYLERELFRRAGQIKDAVYGERLVFFAPLYISDFCINDCDYCNFHARNRILKRKRLTLEEVEEQTRFLINTGHKRILIECGEDPTNNNIDYVVEVIDKIYSVKTNKGDIRRINVNIAATSVDCYQKLKRAKIGTYQLFQETYHRKTYERLHCGLKADYDRQITAHLRAFEAGLDDLGLGVLFGLYDWRFEVLALASHAKYLDKRFGVGPHTISVPRFCPAPTVTYQPEYLVSDLDFFKIIAILRVSVPYIGMIISTRETPQIRRVAFKIGVSQASASSVTSVGGYGKRDRQTQFTIYDERSLEEVIKSILEDSFLPSFCTACYRSNRTGKRFMNLAKPGEISNFCRLNGILTFAEYLEDFTKDGLYKKGYDVINLYLNKIEDKSLYRQTRERLNRIKQGQHDLHF